MSRTPLFAGRGDRSRAGAPSFAHLGAHAGFLGFGGRRQRAEEPSDKDQEDEDARRARRAEEDQRREEEDARRAEEDQRREEEDARRAEEEGENSDGREEGDEATGTRGRRAEDEGGAEEQEDGDQTSGKKGRRADEEDDDAEAKGRRAERDRWSKVLGHRNAAGRVATACNLLATSDSSAASIISTLETIPAQGAAPTLGQRMGGVKSPDVGADASRTSGRSPAATRAAEFLASAHAADPSRVVAPTQR